MSEQQGRAGQIARVAFSKANSGEEYVQIARGTWQLGGDPKLSGDAVPPAVLRGIEFQLCATADRKGTIFYDLSDIRYAMDYEIV